jgi:hypothetical protein
MKSTFIELPASNASLVRRKPVYGVGINNADYVVRPIINGKPTRCLFYQTWLNMLDRCYSNKYQEKYPTYIGCSVAKEWLTFSNFRRWMENQDWKDKHLDKDILNKGNKAYSPENCVFVSGQLNLFLTDSHKARGAFLIGACWHKQVKKYQSQCSNPFTHKYEHLGYFDSEIDAHTTWKKRKHELALIYADMQTDERIASALRTRFL